MTFDPRQFLPAALEVQETPPSPVGRWLLWLLTGFFLAGVLWACLGEVDIVVTAPGRIVPNGQVKQVQAPQAGTVAAILVGEGARVEAGQPLVRLDPTFADADDSRIRRQLNEIAVQATWRRAIEQWLADGWDVATAPALPQRFAAPDQSRAEALYRQQRAEVAGRLSALAREQAANRAEQAALAAEQERARATLAVLAERVGAYRSLLEQRYGARVQYLEILQQQTDLETSIPVLASRHQQQRELAAALAAKKQAMIGEVRKQNLLELARLEAERNTLTQESRKARQQRKQQVLLAPVTGTVQELVVHTVGGVVAPAQELMKIVPENAAIEVEALLQNRDIGFVSAGQRAEIKVDTFNFTKYGLVAAQVVNISHDSVQDERLGWVFRMRLRLAQESIRVEGKRVKLTPGMAVTAEVKTGKRRLIEFFLSPLLRYRQESARER